MIKLLFISRTMYYLSLQHYPTYCILWKVRQIVHVLFTFSPVNLCTAALTLANPPSEDSQRWRQRESVWEWLMDLLYHKIVINSKLVISRVNSAPVNTTLIFLPKVCYILYKLFFSHSVHYNYYNAIRMYVPDPKVSWSS